MGIFGVTVQSSNVADVLRNNKEWSSLYGSINKSRGELLGAENRSINNVLLGLGKTEAALQGNLSQELLSAYEGAFEQKNLIAKTL